MTGWGSTSEQAEYLLTESDVMSLCASRGLRASTRRSYLGTLKSLGLLGRPFTQVDVYLSLEGITNQNTKRKHILNLMAMGVEPQKAPKALPRTYHLPSKDEYEFYRALFQYPDRLDLMYFAGLRVSEATCDLNKLVGNVLQVAYQNGGIPAKTVGNVIIPSWLAAKFPLDPWEGSSNKLSKAMFNHSKRVGIPLTAHGLRAAYATRLVEAGISIVGLQQQMRHANVSTTLTHYVQLKQSNLSSLVEGL